MSFTQSTIRDFIKNTLRDKTSNSLALYDQYIEEACREIYTEWRWEFRKREYDFNTVAPYQTGHLTFTRGSKHITISGGSLTGLVGRKAAISWTAPDYRIMEVAADGLSAELIVEYAEPTTTVATLVYQNEFELPDYIQSNIDIALRKTGYPTLEYQPLAVLLQFMATPQQGASIPRWYNSDMAPTTLSTSQQAIHIMIGPIPKEIHPIRVYYYKEMDAITRDTQPLEFKDSFLPAIKQLALSKAYQYDYQAEAQATAYQLYTAHLEKLKKNIQNEALPIIKPLPCDARRRNIFSIAKTSIDSETR